MILDAMPWCETLLPILLVLSAAADQIDQQSPSSSHRFNIPSSDLQVGCADGSVNHKNHNHQEPYLQTLKRTRRQTENQRQKRNYIHWYGSSSTTYQQPSYVHSFQIQAPLPYYVPIWGNPRRIPVFFPARPILFNPGYPVNNPPLNRPSTEKPSIDDSDEKINIGNRINVNADGEPIWGIVESDTPSEGGNRLPGASSGPDRTPGASSGPDRTPGTSSGADRPLGGRPSRPKTPPLLHRPSLADKDGPQQVESAPSNSQRVPIGQFRPSASTVRPFVTTPFPSQGQGSFQSREEPNRCVWAIISCCNPANNQISYNCFERLGCPGAFWDGSPCNRDVVAAALTTASKFYEQT